MDRAILLKRPVGRVTLLFLLVSLIFCLVILRPAAADTDINSGSPFTVDIAADTTDFIPGDGSCADLQGNCSLRAAIQEANALAGDDTIQVPLSNVTLSLTGHSEDGGATGDLDITDDLTIIGNGATNIDADGIDRVIQVHNGITVTLQALAVINGRTADDAAGSHRHGGGIFNGESKLILQGVEVINNDTSDGIATPGDHKVGGFGGGILSSGQLILNDSQVRNNSTGDGYTGFYYGGDGGGLYIEANSSLTMTNSLVSENTTGQGGGGSGIGAPGGRGGGIHIGSSATTASLTNSYVLNNVTGNGGAGTGGQHGGSGGAGGGIYFVGELLSLTNSYVNGNVTGNGGGGTNSVSGQGVGGPGGGIYAGIASGVMNLSGSTVNNNRTGAGGENGGRGGTGGGINLTGGGSLTLISSQVNGNNSGSGAAANQGGGTGGTGGDGGGLWIYQSAATLISSSVNGNTSGSGAYGDYQGGIGGHGGGIYAALAAKTLSFTDSTLSGNNCGNGGNGGSFAANGGFGGGLFLFDGAASFTMSTINGNVTGDGGGPQQQGSGGRGGGVYSTGTLNLDNSTVSGNSTGDSGGGANSFGGFTGGIVSSGPGNIHNSTISNNTAAYKIGGLQVGGQVVNVSQTIIANNVSTQGTGPDCSGNITSQGYVLVENMHFCNLIGDTTTNITGVDPNLGPLQNNGGATLTHALMSGSPAIDAGNPIVCPSTDQRNYGRPVDGDGDSSAVCDIGAFEIQSTESTTVPNLAGSSPVYFGATMASMLRNTASTDPLTTTVTLTNEPPGGGTPDAGEMPLLWTIDAAVSSGLDIHLALCYTDEQLGSLVELDLEMYRDDGSGWANMGGTVYADQNCVGLDGVTEFSDWTLATEMPVGTKPKFYVYLPAIMK